MLACSRFCFELPLPVASLSCISALLDMAAGRGRWCDMEDSASEDEVPILRRNTFPFYLFLDVFVSGLFRPEVSRSSMATLQRRLQADGRVHTLPPWLQDILLHFAFYPDEIRPQVRAFVRG